MWMMALKFIGSKAGIVTVALVMILALIGWHKIDTVRLKHTIATQQTDIEESKTKRIEQVRLKETCQLSLADAHHAIGRQNELVERTKADADRKVAEAIADYQATIRQPEQVEELVDGPAGPTEMNSFIEDLFAGGAR